MQHLGQSNEGLSVDGNMSGGLWDASPCHRLKAAASSCMHSWRTSLQNGLQCRDVDVSTASKMQLLQATPLHILQCRIQQTWALNLPPAPPHLRLAAIRVCAQWARKVIAAGGRLRKQQQI